MRLKIFPVVMKCRHVWVCLARCVCVWCVCVRTHNNGALLLLWLAYEQKIRALFGQLEYLVKCLDAGDGAYE